MTPLFIILGTGIVLYYMYTKAQEKNEKTNIDKDTGINKGLKAVDKGLGELGEFVFDTISWFETDFVEAWGGEGYHTLKHESKFFNAILKARLENENITLREFSDKNPIFKLDVTYKRLLNCIATGYKIRGVNFCTNYPLLDCNGHWVTSQTSPDPQPGDTEENHKIISDMYYKFLTVGVNFPSNKQQWHDSGPTYYPPDDSYNSIDVFNNVGTTSYKIKLPYKSHSAQPNPLWRFHTLIPGHTYLYVRATHIGPGFTDGGIEERFRDFPLEAQEKIARIAWFGKVDKTYHGFHMKQLFMQENYGTNAVWSNIPPD